MKPSINDSIYWNKLDTTVPISAEKGITIDASVGAPTSVAGVWGNAIYCNALSENAHTSVDLAGMDINEGIIQFKIKTDFNVVSGGAQDGKTHDVMMNWDGAAPIDNMNFFFQTTQARFQITVNNVFSDFIVNSNLNLTAGAWYTITLLWDDSAAVKKRVVYLEDVEIDSSSTSWTIAAWDIPLVLGCRNGGGIDTDLAIDNIKIYPLASLITDVLALKDEEGFYPNQIVGLAASDGTHTTHTALSWTLPTDDTASYKIYRSDDDISYSQIGTSSTNSFNDSTGVAGTVYYYKVAGVNGVGDGDLSAFNTGWRAVFIVPMTPARIVEVEFNLNRPKVLMLDGQVDLYALNRIDKLINIHEKKTFKKDKLIINSIRLKVRNFDNLFSVDNKTKSLFANINWRYQPLQIFEAGLDGNPGERIWNGVVQDVKRINAKKKTAEIISVDVLKKFQEKKVEYESSTWETPADAVKNIMESVGFTEFDNGSIDDSKAAYVANDCYIMVNFNKSSDITLQSALDKMGAVGCADVYSQDNKVFYKHWVPFVGGTSIFIEQKDIRGGITIDSPDKEIINEYLIGYDGDAGVPATDVLNGNIGELSRGKFEEKNLDGIEGGAGSDVIFKDKVSAVYIGECYIKRTNKNYSTKPDALTRIVFNLKGNLKNFIDLNQYLSLTLVDEEWENKIFEVFEIIKNYTKNDMRILAYEVVL